MIKLPNIEWFFGEIRFHGKGNIYSGSFGTDSSEGIFSSDILNFKVWIESLEDDYIFVCNIFKGNKAYCFDEAEIFEKRTFPGIKESIPEIEAFINNYKTEYYSKG